MTDMKKILFSILAVAAVFALTFCTKHKIEYDAEVYKGGDAEIQLHYMAPVANVAANYIDSTYINGVLYANVTGGGSLATYNGLPGGATGRFYRVPAGNVNITLMRGGVEVYNRNVTLAQGKQNVVVYDLNQDPIVLDNKYPYWDYSAPAHISNYGTDSVCKVMFINFLYESVTYNQDGTIQSAVPYPGKLQYQGIRQGEEAAGYFNVGEPVGFGEATDRVELIVHKSVFNSSGYQRIDYRILTESGDVFQKWNGSRMANYTDYWNGYIGRVYMHFFRGNRTQSIKGWTGSGSAPDTQCNVSQWTSL